MHVLRNLQVKEHARKVRIFFKAKKGLKPPYSNRKIPKKVDPESIIATLPCCDGDEAELAAALIGMGVTNRPWDAINAAHNIIDYFDNLNFYADEWDDDE